MDNNSLLTDYDIFLFKQGNHFSLYHGMGAHPMVLDGVSGVFFAVWAPNAEKVGVIGDFNGWKEDASPLEVRGDESGVWEGFVPDVGEGDIYKYHIKSRFNDYAVTKADPFAFRTEEPPRTASRVESLRYEWDDDEWMSSRAARNSLDAPMSVYEVHLGSWKHKAEQNSNRSMSYNEIAKELADYVNDMGYTHIELLPVTEHPFYGSWGYQTTGYFSPTARYGSPREFMDFVNTLHREGVGIILDWVPSHFPSDEHGLVYFDGTHLYEHADPKKGFHPDWQSYIFNYGRNEVRAFLISSALFWLDKYHIDGLRVDAVASMLYLDYSRKEGEWIPNEHGGRENLEAISFLRTFNSQVFEKFPDVQTIAEESTDWPMVSRPAHIGGLGFGMKWNMGWMHDTLQYFTKNPVFRKYHHNKLTFNLLYSFHENFVLSLSHDEVVHGKRSLLDKMPGDRWQKFANMRLLLAHMFSQPGKKLLFMGIDFGQWNEWYHEASLDWHLVDEEDHAGLGRWTKDLNNLYRRETSLHAGDFSPDGFEWIDCNDWEQSTLSLLRKDKKSGERVMVALNLTPVPREGFRVGVDSAGYWVELLNSDGKEYGGSGVGNSGGVEAEKIEWHGRPYSLKISLPPLGAIFFKAP